MSSIDEIVRNCSHEKVAQAAVASLGCDVAGKVGVLATSRGMSVGAFTAQTVRQFHERGGDTEKRALGRAMHGADQPILSGLHHILRPILEECD
ncbi:MAG TPA: hypothetical protein VEQ35_02760 [Beijerinckia sp.]|jgi:hypothetical protein|nr:hypothetical protein [Beijerinckia sp.]